MGAMIALSRDLRPPSPPPAGCSGHLWRRARPHREDLFAEGIRADGIAARREQHRPGRQIGGRAEIEDSAPRPGEYAALRRPRAVRGKLGHLAEVVTDCADGEELVDLVRVLVEGVRRCHEQHAVPDQHPTSAVAADGGIEAVQRGHLHDLPAVDEKDLAHEATGSIGVRGGLSG